ncbi:hypothetical protein CN395_25070 [Priestia megaterium]|uniref:VirD4-like conjugal transfer protein, CD1115 family n=1 Tax=Priestia megaterium TaxID=1404 RepID=UPI000BF76321|nr:type IV secretory system conjugative DNA transfer family protein [Priestia megaterium]PEU54964.1 hypothetical protein CN395_25070 [Priestia megaterium]
MDYKIKRFAIDYKSKRFIIPASAVTAQTAGLSYIGSALHGIAPNVYNNASYYWNDTSALQDFILNDWLLNPGNVLSNIMSNELALYTQGAIGAWWLYKLAKISWNARKHRVEKSSKYGAYGTAEFLTAREIEADTEDFSMSLESPGTIIGMVKGKPVIHHEKSWKNRNVLIFGASGTQKSKSYIIPNILNTDSDSIIVTDAKGELYRDTSEAKRKQGYKVHVISFVLNESKHSDKYNPLDYVETDADAAELGNSLVINGNGVPSNGDTFWVNAEAGLIATLVLYTKYFLPKEQQNLGTVYNLTSTDHVTLYKLFKDIPEDHIVRRSYDGCIGNKEDKMKDQIIGGASTAIDLWKYDEVRELTCQSDFNLQDIGKEKTIVYIRIPVGKKYSRPLISTFYVQLFDQLYALGEESETGELPNPVRMLLDEFCNIGTIPMFEEKLSTTRGYKIYVSPVVQSLEQLRDRYGEKKAAEIMDNCDIHMLLGTNDKDAQKHFSEKIGNTTIRIQGESETKNDRGESLGESLNYAQRPLLTADEVNRLPDNKSIVFMRTKQPFLLEKAFYTKLKPIAAMLGEKRLIKDYKPPRIKPYDIFKPRAHVAKIEREEALKEEALQAAKKAKEKKELVPYLDEQEVLANVAAADPEEIEQTPVTPKKVVKSKKVRTSSKPKIAIPNLDQQEMTLDIADEPKKDDKTGAKSDEESFTLEV